MNLKSFAVLACISIASLSHAQPLLDFRPASTSTTGYAVGNSFFRWGVYQPFTVTSPAGWDLDRIWISGYRSAGLNSGDVRLEIALNNTAPALATTSLTITNTAAGTLAYVSGDIDVTLAGNTSYVLRILPNATNPATDVGIHYGITGPVVTSISAGNGFTRVQNTPIATYFEGSVVPAPHAALPLALAALAARRRRR